MYFSTVYNLLSNIFRSIGDVKLPLYFLVMACENIILDIVFIAVFGMELKGRLCNSFSQIFSAVACVVYI